MILLFNVRCIDSTIFWKKLQKVYYNGHPKKLDLLFCTALYLRTSSTLLQEKTQKQEATMNVRTLTK